jgi:hypothetical protein
VWDEEEGKRERAEKGFFMLSNSENPQKCLRRYINLKCFQGPSEYMCSLKWRAFISKGMKSFCK